MLTQKDFRKLCDVIYRRTGIAMDDKKYNILTDLTHKTILMYNTK